MGPIGAVSEDSVLLFDISRCFLNPVCMSVWGEWWWWEDSFAFLHLHSA